MDTLENQNISGKRVKIIDDDNDAVTGTVETVDYVKGKIGLMADGQNGRLEYYFRCDIKKIFIIDDNNESSSAVADDRRAFQSNQKDLNKAGDKVFLKAASKEAPCDKVLLKASAGDKGSLKVGHFGREHNQSSSDSGFKASDNQKKDSNNIDCDNKIPADFESTDSAEKCNSSKPPKLLSQSRDLNLNSGFEPVGSIPNSEYLQDGAGQHTNKRDQEPRRPDRLLKKGIKTENVHLRNLHHVDMNSVLGRTNVEPVEQLEEYKDEEGFSFLMLPSVTCTTTLSQDMNGQVVNPTKQQRVIRDLLWKSPSEPPPLHTPGHLYIIEEIGDLFHETVQRIRTLKKRIVGVSLEGEVLGRVGTLCYLLISTEQNVFMYDILKLGKEAFQRDLKAILEDDTIIKVFHDARQPSDILFHQYDIILGDSVFDTLAADIEFHLRWSVHKGFIQRYARALPHMAKEYLGVADSDLFFPKYRRTRLKEDTSIWRQRPLPSHLILGAARRAIYLLPLQAICERAVLHPFDRAVAALLSCVRDADEPDAASMVHETAVLPFQVRSALPKWNLDAAAIERSGLKVDGFFVHQNVGSMDPQLIFSKDAMHQSDPHFKPAGRAK